MKIPPPQRTLAIALAVVAVFFLAPLPLGGATSYVIVAGSSMSPTFEDGDLVVVRRGTYGVGDVVAFETGSGVVIHRIIGGSPGEGFLLQGDNRTRPDTWRPTPDEVIGKETFHIPGAGDRILRLMTDPMMLGGVFGGLGTLMISNPARRRIKRHGAHEAGRRRGSRKAAPSANPIPAAGITLTTLWVLVLLPLGTTIYLYLQPLQRTVPVEATLAEHTGTHGYVATVQPSVVYDGTTIASTSAEETSTVIYTQLLEELQIDFRYEMSPHTALNGRKTLSSQLQVGAGENRWTRNLPLLPRRSFEGSSVSESFTVDIPFLLSLIERAEEETGYSPSAYDISVVTLVNVTDDAGDQIDESLEVALPMQLNATLLTIENELSLSETITTSEEEVVPNEIEVLGLALPVRQTRTIASIAFVGSLLAAVSYGLVVRRLFGKGEAARIRLRYGSLIVPVSGMSANGSHKLTVESMSDLVRLARQAEQMVFYDNERGHTFSVPDGSVVYEYTIEHSRGRRK